LLPFPVSGLAWDEFANMYAVRRGSSHGLYKVNILTGTAALIGPTGTGPVGGLRFANGNLYMSATVGGPGPSNLYTVNIATGTATLVGATGFDNVVGLAMIAKEGTSNQMVL
jgi:hypothetical protein